MRRAPHLLPPHTCFRKKNSFRVVCILFAFLLFYFYVFNAAPPPYEIQPVDNYDLTDANQFRTIPFYKKSSYERSGTDVTLITQVSVDRLNRIQSMADSWDGPISVSVYVKHEKDLELIDELFSQSNILANLVDFHVLFANKTRYPVNNLRNLAILNARTSLVMILDADFVTSGNLHEYLSEFGKQLETHEKLAYVIPAFSSDMRPDMLPKSKPELLTAIKHKQVALVNEGPCPKCHKPTNYAKWQITSAPYDVEYKWIYEPYLVLNKANLKELFDERLKGYGFDKNTHTYALAVAGYTFEVLPNAFIIHVNHPVADWDGPSIQDQLWQALKYVCVILPATKEKYGYPPDAQLFDEPVGDQACFSRDHW